MESSQAKTMKKEDVRSQCHTQQQIREESINFLRVENGISKGNLH